MPIIKLQTAGRQYKRQFDKAIRNNLIRALTELITNSDDSYSRLEEKGDVSGDILIIYDRKKKCVSVIDNAEGITKDIMIKKFGDYGAATSGLKEGRRVRGYFGKGIKDVLFSMNKGRVRSIKENKLYVTKFVWNRDNTPQVNIGDRFQNVNKGMREKLKINGNGTIVDFEIPEVIPLSRHETVLKNLANFYMLRMINLNKNRLVRLMTINTYGEVIKGPVRYKFPTGEKLLDEKFIINIDGFNPFSINLGLYRSYSPLTQEGDDREGGLLIVDENGTVLDLTLFGYDRNEYTSNLFGILKIDNFRELLYAEEGALSDSRDGLDIHHKFYKLLKKQVDIKLKPIIQAEKKKHREGTEEISRKHRKRMDASIKKINQLLNELTSQDWSAAGGNGNGKTSVNGLVFVPSEINLFENKKTRVRLVVNTDDIPPGTRVKISSDTSRISVSPIEFEVISHPEEKLVNHYITLHGTRVGSSDVISAYALDFKAIMYVEVIAEDYPTPENSFAFIPDVIRLPSNELRYAYLYIRNDVGAEGDIISLETNNPNIQILNPSIIIEHKNFRQDIAKIIVPLKGIGIGQSAKLTAKINGNTTSLSIDIVTKRTRRSGATGLITGYEFSSKPSRKRSSYDEETGLIFIYEKNPVVAKYFHKIEKNLALSLPHCQVFLAEVILEAVATLARKKMIESKSAIYLSDNHTEEDLIAINNFIYEYGTSIHSWIVDNSSLQQAINVLETKID